MSAFQSNRHAAATSGTRQAREADLVGARDQASAGAGADYEVVGKEAIESAEQARGMARLHNRYSTARPPDLSRPPVTRKGDSADTAGRKNTAEALEAGGS